MQRHSTIVIGSLSFALVAGFALWTHRRAVAAEEGIMRQKLTAAQKVLEGLAQRDFDMIEKNASELTRLSRRAEWGVFKTPEYILRSDEFRRNAEGLVKASKEKNLDAATLAYVQLTMDCVKCHNHVRDLRMAGAPGTPAHGE